jgi:hypothetical protein
MSSCAQLQHASSASAIHCVSVSIGGTVIALRTSSAEFSGQLKQRYGHFVTQAVEPEFEFDVELAQPFGEERLDEDVRVWWESGTWYFERGDFRAQWNPVTRRGTMLHLPNPYAVDAILRITHTLLLAGRGGFLLHAASAIRNGRAFIFAGISGAGKTTIARLAPPEAVLLSDEVSYVCRTYDSYRAYGTPFAGELATLGESSRAPIAALFLLEKAAENRIEPVLAADVVRAVLRNTLFFAQEPKLVEQLFRNACHFVESVPVRRLYFVPNTSVWELIQ